MKTPEVVEIHSPAEKVGVITLNRPEAANAINTQLANALARAITKASTEYRVLVLTGAGPKVFCAGADLKERRGMTLEAWEQQHEAFKRALHTLLDCPLPLIAAVNGAAYGGGLELMLACDFAYAADTARFALTEATLGIMPGMGGTQTLPRAIGHARALEMLFTGQPCDAQEALQWGLVNAIGPADTLMPHTLEVAQRIAHNAPLSLRQIKRAVRGGQGMRLRDALAVERENYGQLIATKDRNEGINAFNEKRQPKFRGE